MAITMQQIMDERLARLEAVLGYVFADKAHGLESLVETPGIIYNGLLVEKNERLALLGDRIINLLLTELWYPTDAPRSVETHMRTKSTDNQPLFELGMSLGLDACIIRNPGEAGQLMGRRAMATAMEAFIGAVYCDAEYRDRETGLAAVKRVVDRLGLYRKIAW